MPSRPSYVDPKVADGRTVYVSNEETGEMSVVASRPVQSAA